MTFIVVPRLWTFLFLCLHDGIYAVRRGACFKVSRVKENYGPVVAWQEARFLLYSPYEKRVEGS